MWKIVLVVACALGSLGLSIVKSDAPQCPQNEQYSNCSNALCRAQKCEHKGIQIPCPGVYSCDKSCVCVYGYLRNSKGICVAEDQCDVAPACPENQVLSNCSNALCRHQECSERSKPVACPGVYRCHTGCVCDEGYLKNSNGNCVKEDQCD